MKKNVIQEYNPPQTISRQIAQHLAKRIINGEFEDGYQLRILNLTEEYNASQTSIREALQVLESSFMIEYTPRRGYSVSKFTKKDKLMNAKIKHSLWSLATVEAAKNCCEKEELREELIKYLEKFLQSLNDNKPDVADIALDGLNIYILNNCDSNYLMHIVPSFENQIKLYRFRDCFRNAKIKSIIIEYYSNILKAVKENKPESVDNYRLDVSSFVDLYNS